MTNTLLVEILAAIFGLLSVWLATKQHILCWAMGLLNVVLSMFVFYWQKLYYDFILQIFYFVITLYGWYNWIYGKDKQQNKLPITKISSILFFIYFGVVIALSIILGYLSMRFTDASLPYLDAFTTVGGIIATFAMARKIIQHWIAWIIIDVVCTGMYLYKEMYAFSILYLLFTILAIKGYLQWNKEVKEETVLC